MGAKPNNKENGGPTALDRCIGLMHLEERNSLHPESIRRMPLPVAGRWLPLPRLFLCGQPIHDLRLGDGSGVSLAKGMPNSLQNSAIGSPASRRATNCSLSSITEHSFQGITSSSRRKCYLCVRYDVSPMSQVGHRAKPPKGILMPSFSAALGTFGTIERPKSVSVLCASLKPLLGAWAELNPPQPYPPKRALDHADRNFQLRSEEFSEAGTMSYNLYDSELVRRLDRGRKNVPPLYRQSAYSRDSGDFRQCNRRRGRTNVVLVFPSSCGKIMVDSRKGLDEAGLFEFRFRSLYAKPPEISELCDCE